MLGLIKSIKLSQARMVELGTSFSDKTGHVLLEAAAKPHKDHRITATCALALITAFQPLQPCSHNTLRIDSASMHTRACTTSMSILSTEEKLCQANCGDLYQFECIASLVVSEANKHGTF